MPRRHGSLANDRRILAGPHAVGVLLVEADHEALLEPAGSTNGRAENRVFVTVSECFSKVSIVF